MKTELTKKQKQELKALKQYLKDKPKNWTKQARQALAIGAVFDPKTDTFNWFGRTMAFTRKGELEEL